MVENNFKKSIVVKNYYFTFGYGHIHGPFGYVKIQSGSASKAREIMISMYGLKWSMQYTEEKFLPQIEKYNLHEIK